MKQVGEKVWKSGGAWERENEIEVTSENVKFVNMFWNRLYFETEKEAALETNIAHARYGEYQAEAVNGLRSILQ